jgi:biopolymer transport protein ExbD
MKSPFDHDETGEEFDDRADLVPLIDCVFLVLLFYVVAATFSEESIFPVELPRVHEDHAKVEINHPDKAVTVWISAEGTFALDKTPVEPRALPGLLRERLAAKGKDALLVIRGDRRAPYEMIAGAVEVAQSLGVARFSLVVERNP